MRRLEHSAPQYLDNYEKGGEVQNLIKGFAQICFFSDVYSAPAWLTLDRETILQIQEYKKTMDQLKQLPVRRLPKLAQSPRNLRIATRNNMFRVAEVCSNNVTAILAYHIKYIEHTVSEKEARRVLELICAVANTFGYPRSVDPEKDQCLKLSHMQISRHFRRLRDKKGRLVSLPECCFIWARKDQWIGQADEEVLKFLKVPDFNILKEHSSLINDVDPRNLSIQDLVSTLDACADNDGLEATYFCTGGIKHAAMLWSYLNATKHMSDRTAFNNLLIERSSRC